ncbi:hypothetical protein BCR36DRAFT_588498 [Piromyces finnis]|uniref:MATH domain-containing protein n=1 Tax=Piromyces finnis TaxID=1754191 RepID=A0A1Y1UDW2_9FUNG|nr:hypothetical protein BCR36DRAFT_588498 [Piromyces finnis]|eukprot:ORX36179.1 hypothetical protein BCR36DRAFT_588498 [Piromyces finnis]
MDNLKIVGFLWCINNYSKLPDTEIFSQCFWSSGQSWRLSIYPKGIKDKSDDYLSVFLEAVPSTNFKETTWKTDTFSATFFLRTEPDAPVDIVRRASKSAQEFTSSNPSWNKYRPSTIELPPAYENEVYLIQIENEVKLFCPHLDRMFRVVKEFESEFNNDKTADVQLIIEGNFLYSVKTEINDDLNDLIDLYRAADKYQLESLMNYIHQSICSRITCQNACSSCLEFIAQHLSTIYSTPDFRNLLSGGYEESLTTLFGMLAIGPNFNNS